ncbi:DUF116 domain-containing protein, partial [Desulfovibrio sp. OttesenSCG-928-I05]|nr:DUF116 domain-containing protein [Desulfovibrio sp. OttesenSCG-928-I05]
MEELRPGNPHDSGEASRPDTGGKRLFVRLSLAASALVCIVLFLAWLVPAIGFESIHPALPLVTGIIVAALAAFILFAAIAFAVHARTGRPFPGSSLFRTASIRFFLPFIELVGRLFGFSPETVRHSFIVMNNDMVRSAASPVPPDRILILLPHCLQRASCGLRLSHDPDLCRRCGQCPMGGLLDLRDRYGVHLAVATGGTLARRIVKQTKPRFIIAVACERDLSSGIQDTYPLP